MPTEQPGAKEYQFDPTGRGSLASVHACPHNGGFFIGGPMPALVVLAIIAAVLYNCMGGSPPQSARDQRVEVGVHFILPEAAARGRDAPGAHIGNVIGVAACEAAAREHARALNLSPSSGWDYYCCTHEDGVQCRRRIR